MKDRKKKKNTLLNSLNDLETEKDVISKIKRKWPETKPEKDFMLDIIT